MNEALFQSWQRVVNQVAAMHEKSRPLLDGRWPDGQEKAVDAVGHAMAHGTNEEIRDAIDTWNRRWCAWLARAGK